MAHAKVGDYIKIIDDYGGDWVRVGKTYKVLDVSGEDCDSEKRFYLEGVDAAWYAKERHYTIVPSPTLTLTHPKYDTFEEGDTVRRWRDVEEEEWENIGEIPLPPIGKDVEVHCIEIGKDHKEDSFHSEPYGWLPMKAFVLAEYYNHTITNRGTAALNDYSYGKSKSAGIIIEVQRPLASISTGQRTSRSGVQGRGNAAVTRGGYSSHQAITGR